MAELVMPRLSDTMEEGTILRWLKADGDEVARGEELVEIETDKATMTYESDQAGVLQIIAAEGDTLAVGAPIAHVGDAGSASVSTPPAAAVSTPATADDEPASGPAGVGAAGVPAVGGAPPAAAKQAPPREQTPKQPAVSGRIKASPLARRIAEESGVDLHNVTGSGPGGRIVKADVVESPVGVAQAPTPSGLESVATAKGETTTVELSRTQQTIARRMAESKATIPDFTLLIDVDMEECVRLRSELKRLSQPQAGSEGASGAQHDVPTYNDMVVKASALALREHPRANASYRDGRLQLHSRVNVGVAVAAEDALVVPTVFDAEEKSLGEIARETRALAERVRDGTITPPELGGGTFTVSNLGMYGIKSFAAIINPPQAAILSVGALAPRPVAREGELVVRNTMTLTLACDHRILYGANAALLLARIRALLESPSALTL